MKWGILATGTIAAKFADTIMKMEGQTVVACASRTVEKAREFANTYEIEKAYGSYQEMVEDKDVEVVYIATPNNLHYENAKMCLEAGKHVLCEKPFTINYEEAEKLFDLAAEKHLFIMEAFWVRFLPGAFRLRELVEEGVIGDVVWARSEYGFGVAGARRERKFVSQLGGGALLDIGIYNLGFMRMIMGNTQPVAFQSQVHINEYGTDDFSTIMLEYPKGQRAVVTTAIGTPLGRRAMIFGTKGAIEIEDHQYIQKFLVKPYGEEAYEVNLPFEVNGFEYQIKETERCIRLGQINSEYYNREDTLESMKLMDDIRASWGMKFTCE